MPPTLRRRLELLAFGALTIAWIAIGIWHALGGAALPRWYWWPLIAVAVPVLTVWLFTYVRGNDFSPEPWLSRRDEFGRLFKQLWSWKDPLGREWQLWFLAVFVGIPFMAVCLVVAPGDTDRLGSAIGLVTTALIAGSGSRPSTHGSTAGG